MRINKKNVSEWWIPYHKGKIPDPGFELGTSRLEVLRSIQLSQSGKIKNAVSLELQSKMFEF